MKLSPAARQQLDRLENRWLELDILARADEQAVLANMLTKAEYIERDLQRQAERKALEEQAQIIIKGKL